MREARVEKRLVDKVGCDLGGLVWKWVSPGRDGVPDRVVLLPGGRVVFVELKAPGEKPRPKQKYVMELMRALGMDVRVIDSIEAVHAFVEEMRG